MEVANGPLTAHEWSTDNTWNVRGRDMGTYDEIMCVYARTMGIHIVRVTTLFYSVVCLMPSYRHFMRQRQTLTSSSCILRGYFDGYFVDIPLLPS